MITDSKINEFIRSYIKAPGELLSELELYASEKYVPIAKPETAAFLRTICAMKRPGRILEAGTAIGYSAIVMAEYLADGGKIDTIEIDEDTARVARDNIERAGLKDKVNVIIADATEVFRCIDKKYDLVFLDAAKGQYKEILADAKRVLNVGGVLVSDNVLFDGRVTNDTPSRKFRTIVVNMREYLKCLTEDDCFQTSLLSVGDGLTLSVKIKE